MDSVTHLKKTILNEGKSLPGNILKVDSFLNHQLDVKLAESIGEAFYERFKDKPVTKILTIESSGILYAVMTAIPFGYIPVVYGKKGNAANMDEQTYIAEAFSYTRRNQYTVRISKEYLNKNDHVLIIDDFLANGEAVSSLISIANQAGAVIEGIGIIIEKSWQDGRRRIKELGYDVDSLVRVVSLDGGSIVLSEE